MNTIKRKSIIAEGMTPELVRGANFDGIFEIPIITAPKCLIPPPSITPFTQRNKVSDFDTAIGFYEMDVNFAEILITPENYIDDFRRFRAIITPDASLYRDAPLSVQIANTYRNRAIGCYYQRHGIVVIPQVRWGSEATYTTKLLPEKVAFLGVEKHSIVAIGTYGCIQTKQDKYHFKAGLEAMLQELEPTVVLVYGSMPNSIFGDYLQYARFVQYPDWITSKKGVKR